MREVFSIGKANIFQLIHTVEKMNNENIVRFTKKYPYPIGISPILVMYELREKGPLKQVELAECLGYTKGAMTSIANKLVSNELVERIYDKTDRRTIHLQITDKGLQALIKAHEIGEEIHLDIYESLTEEEIETYLKLIEKIINRNN